MKHIKLYEEFDSNLLGDLHSMGATESIEIEYDITSDMYKKLPGLKDRITGAIYKAKLPDSMFMTKAQIRIEDIVDQKTGKIMQAYNFLFIISPNEEIKSKDLITIVFDIIHYEKNNGFYMGEDDKIGSFSKEIIYGTYSPKELKKPNNRTINTMLRKMNFGRKTKSQVPVKIIETIFSNEYIHEFI